MKIQHVTAEQKDVIYRGIKVENFYRCFVIGIVILQLAWFFIPWGFAYDENSIKAIYWLGYSSVFESKSIVIISYIFLLVYTLSRV